MSNTNEQDKPTIINNRNGSPCKQLRASLSTFYRYWIFIKIYLIKSVANGLIKKPARDQSWILECTFTQNC